MGPLSQFLLDFAVNVQILLEMTDFFNQLFVLEDKFLWLFWLELELACKLVILQNCQASSRIKLLLFQRK